MINSASEFVRLRNSEDKDDYDRAAHDEAPLEVWWQVVREHPEMKMWVVTNKTVPLLILEALSTDEDAAVRDAVARKRKASREILERLATDSDSGVRLAVACNKSTSVEILKVLVNDPWGAVASHAKARLGIDPGPAIHGDCWRGALNDEWCVDEPSWGDVCKAIERLDARTFTMVTIQGPGEQHLTIGGGAGQYVVYATFDNCEFWNLLSATRDDGIVLLNAGGQEGDYPAHQIVDMDQAQTAARAFFERLQMDPSLRWQSPVSGRRGDPLL